MSATWQAIIESAQRRMNAWPGDIAKREAFNLLQQLASKKQREIKMGNLLDLTKPVWRVGGKIPDGRRMTCFVNAANETDAQALAAREGMFSFESDRTFEIDVETGWRKK